MRHEVISADSKQTPKDYGSHGIAEGAYRAQDFMSSTPIFLKPYASIQQAMETFRTYAVNSILVVDAKGPDGGFQLSGRITIKNVFRQLFPGLKQKDLLVLNQVLHEPVEKAISKHQLMVNSSLDIRKILPVILKDCSQLAGVQHDEKLVGQIYGTDLLKVLKINENDNFSLQLIKQALPTTKVSEIMIGHVLCLSPQDEISKAMEVFMATDTPYIAILNEQGKLMRILFSLDVLEYILELVDSKELIEFEKKGLVLDRTIGSMAEKEFTTIKENSDLAEAVAIMVAKNVFYLAVTDVQQRFYGLFSYMDILAWIQRRLG